MQAAIIAISFLAGMAAGVTIFCLMYAKRQQECSDEKITDAYNKGYWIGRKEGYGQGYSEGLTDGYDRGYVDASEEDT